MTFIPNHLMSRHSSYQTRIEEFSSREGELSLLSSQYSNYRLAAFGVGVGFLIIPSVFTMPQALAAVMYLLSLIGFAGFVVLIIRHRRILREEERFRLLRQINEQAIHRLNREWNEFPVPDAPVEFTSLAKARDLDLFGPASLFQLLSVQRTPQGRTTLARWLIETATPEEAIERQISAGDLSDHLAWRQELAVIGDSLAVDDAVIIPEWLERDRWFHRHDRLIQYLPFAPWVSLAALGLTILIPQVPVILLALGFHAYLVGRHREAIRKSLEGLSEEDRKVRAYSEAFAFVEGCPAQDGLLGTLIPRVEEAGVAMEALNGIATGASARGSLVHPLLIGFALYDLRIVRQLEDWQKENQEKMPGWFEALGEIEALCNLGGLCHDEPDWTMPTFEEEKCRIEARELGHPLIGGDKRVSNDVAVGPEGNFLLVTGSNMAGKSTLLRSIGLNVTLAQAGAPVCAQSLRTPALTIATSMVVHDSLVDGVSFFMAELQRIKEIVDLANEEHARGRSVLFLLDEILQGTNTVERREIVQRVVGHLVNNKAIGAITTHDLALAESDSLVKHADLIHFREHFERDAEGRPHMTFDYKIRPGVATTTNALKILEVIEMGV